MSSAVQPPRDNERAGGRDPGPTTDRSDDPAAPLGRRDVVAREKDEFGGMKFGAGFFGWLAATGMAVLLTALVAGVGTALGLGGRIDPANPSGGDLRTAGIVGGIVLLVVILIAYFCGGYVAGRMARFSGLKQGLAVWLWAVIIAIVVAILAVVAGSSFDIPANVNGFPRIPVNQGELTTAGVITAVSVALVSLLGAILGGLAGMRFHRRVDRAGLDR